MRKIARGSDENKFSFFGVLYAIPCCQLCKRKFSISSRMKIRKIRGEKVFFGVADAALRIEGEIVKDENKHVIRL